jgi:uncharacterized membrane protein
MSTRTNTTIGRRLSLAVAALAGVAALGAPTASADASAASAETARAGKATSAGTLMPAAQRAGIRSSGLLDRAVSFRNGTGQTVWVAIMRHSPGACTGHGDWQTRGWYRLEPGEVKQALTTDNRYAYYYAKAANGAEWRGPFGRVYVYNRAFTSCLGIGSSEAYGTVGMRTIDLGRAGLYHTINLI